MVIKAKNIFKKGRILIVLAAIAVLAVPFSVFAATSDTTAAKSIRGFFGIDTTKLTDAQKQTVKDYSQKLADLQKDFINSMVSNGAMTKEQGDEAIQQIENNLKNSENSGIIPGFGMGKGFGKRVGEFGLYGIDVTKLTDAQKKDIIDSYKQMAGIQKELLGKMAGSNIITQEQSDAAVKKIDEMIADLDKNGLTGNAGKLMCFGAFRFFGLPGFKASSLTDDQKSILTDYSKKLADAQKELVNKLVSDGALTKEQGDAAIKAIDNRLANESANGFSGKGMMKGGRMGGFRRNGSDTGNSPAQTTPASLQATTGTL